ncbi:MAG: glutamate-1-semialdehyde-2,1-aminomutase [Flavobacteriales bacterium]|nr:glutamate-1-semialdehyde-2,1-aminomutase [Flavobacteriales bacterium]|tara:strand:- start:41406 stop:42689 length:1284 start_codon:yes stop_codon:yes gene_type:complete
MKLDQSKALMERANKSLVGGVNSPVRAFNSVGGDALFIEKAKGIYITDVDGNEYIDLVGSYGPMILGHAHPKVNEAVKKALDKSYTYGATTEGEVEMAEMIKEAFPQIDKVRFVNSGTEAVFSAIRLARAYTGRDKIVKFAGCYHGHSDSLLVAAGSGVATLGIPGSKGVPEAAVKDTLIAQYNDIESVKTILEKYPNEIAGIFIEPVAGNMGVVVPEQEFMKELRALTKEHGIALVIDEVMTGFRQKFGGAQDYFGIEADIICMGKVIGGGMPVGAYAGKAEIMDLVSPLGGVYQAGTLSGSPIAMACGLATLKELKNYDYQKADEMGKKVKAALEAAAAEAGVEVTVNQFGLMVNPFFTNQKVTDFDSAQTSDTSLFAKFFWAMAENGLYIPPSQFEAWFLPIVLTDEELNEIIKRIHAAFQAIK